MEDEGQAEGLLGTLGVLHRAPGWSKQGAGQWLLRFCSCHAILPTAAPLQTWWSVTCFLPFMFSKPPLNVLRTQKLPKHTSKAPQPLKNTKKGETIFATCSPSWAPFWHPQTSPKTIARLQKSFKAFFTEPLIGVQFFPWGNQHKCFPCGISQLRAL